MLLRGTLLTLILKNKFVRKQPSDDNRIFVFGLPTTTRTTMDRPMAPGEGAGGDATAGPEAKYRRYSLEQYLSGDGQDGIEDQLIVFEDEGSENDHQAHQQKVRTWQQWAGRVSGPAEHTFGDLEQGPSGPAEYR